MTQAGKTAEAISGRATGVLFFAGFGSLWLATGLSAMHRLNPISLAAIGTIFAALVIPAVILLRAASKAPHSSNNSTGNLEAKRVFHHVNTIQWIAIVAVALLLNLLHKQEFLVPVIAFIVGMHLFPLARVFRYRPHHVTGTLLVLWAIGVTAVLPGSALPSVGAVGTATILLLSAAYTLANTSRSAKAAKTPGAASRQSRIGALV